MIQKNKGQKVENRIATAARAFLRREEGTAAPLLAIGLLALIGAAGLAFDSGRGFLMQSQLSQAVDAAALAGGRSLKKGGDSDHKEQIIKYFRANLADGFLGASIADPDINVNEDGDEIEVVASAMVPTTLMQVLGFQEMEVSARAVVSRTLKGLEIAMVLDNSGSMKGGKLSDLKVATTTLLDTLYGTDNEVEDLHVSLVPFTARTNLRGQGALLREEDDDDDIPVPSHVCFDLRAGQLRIDDSPPEEGAFELYSGPLNPEIDPDAYRNDICPTAPVLPLARSRSDIDTAVNDMAAQGCTRYDVGTAWGWRALSPDWRGVWEDVDAGLPVDYRSREIQKAAIIMTDGKNTPVDCAQDGDSKAASEAAFAESCQGMKDEGVLVYTITFKLEDAATNALFESCASGSSRYFKSPTGEQLDEAFANIASDLTNLRLSE